jgi:hypothetical protein
MKGNNSHKEYMTNSALNRLLKNKDGSVLITVIMVSAVVFILTVALLMRVNTSIQLNQQANYNESAYLAAKSGLSVLEDKSNSDNTFAGNVFLSAKTSNPKPIVMDMGDLGTCEIRLTELSSVTEDDVTTKVMDVECKGIYEGSEYTLNRKLTMTSTTTTSDTSAGEFKPAGFRSYADGNVTANGSVTGDSITHGDATLFISNTKKESPMGRVIAKNSVYAGVGNVPTYVKLIAAGKSVTAGQLYVKSDVYVGNYDSNTDDGYVQDACLYVRNYLLTQGTVKVDGDVIVAGRTDIYSDNTDYSDKLDIQKGSNPSRKGSMTAAAITARGNVYFGYSVDCDSDGAVKYTDTYDSAGNKTGSEHSVPQKYSVWENMQVFGSVYSGGDVYLSGNAIIYGDVIAAGNVYVDGYNVKIYGNIYAGGNDSTVTRTVNGTTKTGFSVVLSGDWGVYDTNGLFKNFTGNTEKHQIHAASNVYVGDTPTYYNYTISENESSMDKMSTFVGDYAQGAYNVNAILGDDHDEPDVNTPSDSDLPVVDSNFTSDYDTINNVYTTKKILYQDGSTSNLSNLESDSNKIAAVSYYVGNHSDSDIGNYNQYNREHMIYISSSCKVILSNASVTESGTDITCDGGYQGSLYIDTSRYGQDIDVHLYGSLNPKLPNSIIVNDNGGQNMVRIFMHKGSVLNVGNPGNRSIWLATNNDYSKIATSTGSVDDFNQNTTLSEALATPEEYMHVMPNLTYEKLDCVPVGDDTDDARTAMLFIFSEDIGETSGEKNTTCTWADGTERNYTCLIDTGSKGTIPGYILAPYAMVYSKSNASEAQYQGGADDETKITKSRYPSIYGMLLCNYSNFNLQGETFIKYDTDLDKNGKDGEEPSDTYKMYLKATNGVMDTGGGTTDDNNNLTVSSSVTYTLVSLT